ncbi:unnamed protein product [Moneuplotes crassus]|uniref:Uncharacterized protein n=1 Tax=Euplotes crassus TaxID=5936 RepID=A0AAD1U803_EUPCR|nr:unnamed protein product [Moneuplotes crassus]
MQTLSTTTGDSGIGASSKKNSRKVMNKTIDLKYIRSKSSTRNDEIRSPSYDLLEDKIIRGSWGRNDSRSPFMSKHSESLTRDLVRAKMSSNEKLHKADKLMLGCNVTLGKLNDISYLIKPKEDFVKIRNTNFKRSKRAKRHKETSTGKDKISQSSYYAEKIGLANPSINMTSRSSILSMKKSRNTSEKQNSLVISASASRRRSRAERDLNYNSSNMRSFDLLPHKGPIKVLRRIAMASCSPKNKRETISLNKIKYNPKKSLNFKWDKKIVIKNKDISPRYKLSKKLNSGQTLNKDLISDGISDFKKILAKSELKVKKIKLSDSNEKRFTLASKCSKKCKKGFKGVFKIKKKGIIQQE